MTDLEHAEFRLQKLRQKLEAYYSEVVDALEGVEKQLWRAKMAEKARRGEYDDVMPFVPYRKDM
jgi:hypothetical protein